MMDLVIVERFKHLNVMDMALIRRLMARYTLETGKTIKKKEEVSSHGLMAKYSMDILLKIIEKASESSPNLMVLNT